jgi:pilus assembly protein CpaC
MFNKGKVTRFIGNIGDGVPNGQLPVTNGKVGGQGDGLVLPCGGGLNVACQSLTVSPFVSAGVLSGAAPFGFLIGKLLASGIEADILLNALETRGLAQGLAEPNLVALSGDTANFLAGGEYPIPVPGTFGQISVEYKRYGVGLAFTPTVLSRGLINLKIEPEVSQLDPANSVAVGNNISRTGPDRATRELDNRAARRAELRARRPAAEHLHHRPAAIALARRRAGARRAVLEQGLSEE